MKTRLSWVLMMTLGFAGGTLANGAEAKAAAAEKVGVYDSRAVAYAHFWSPAASREREATIAAAKAAKAAGNTADYDKHSAAMAALQKKMHEEVFSSAPAAEALAALAPRLPALQGELGVTRLVSKWDAKALRPVPEANRVDVTDRLVREFITPTEKQQKVLDSMKAKEPISLWRIKVMNLFGSA
jgi:hypothetical protein